MTEQPTHDLRRVQLANGVTLLVQARRAAPAVALVAHVRAGFLDEPDDLVGISHVLEHMLFKGTPSLGPGELARRTKALGGSLNAYTSYDRTVYYASGPARQMREFIALQADQVRNATIDAGELARELGVIIQEARRKLDSPGAVAGETLHELLFASHRLRRWRIGVEATLERFTRDDVAGYYRSRYAPERAIIALVGDVDPDAAIGELRSHWQDWESVAAVIPTGPAERTPPGAQTRTLRGDVAIAELVLGWRAPGILDGEIPALDMAAAILGLGRGSRLARALREPGLVNAIGVSNYGVVDAGVFAVGAELDAARIEESIGEIGAAIRDLAANAPATIEFDRAMALLRSRLGRHLERYESRALALAAAEALGDVTRLDREEAELLAVTPADVQAVAAKWLDPADCSAVAYLPEGDRGVFDVAMVGNALRLRGWASGADEAAAGRPTPKSESSVASIRPYAQRVTPDASIHHLPLAGTDILTARFGQTGQVSLAMYRNRDLIEDAGTAGLAALGLRSMLRGTEDLDAASLAIALESLGGTLSPALGSDVLGLSTTVLAEHAVAAAALLADVFHRPRLDPAVIAIERGLLLEDARAVADDMFRFPLQLALGVAFADTGYGSPVLGTEHSVASLTAERVREWHAAMLRGGRTTVIAVGDADPVRLAEDLATILPSPVSLPFPFSVLPSPLTMIEPGLRVEHRARNQAALAMVFPGPARNAPERFAAETWGAIAAGLGGRMFESLRSARSLAYTVVANSWQRRRSGALVTYIATDPARLEEAREAMLEELDLFRREPPEGDELSRATAMLAGQAEVSRQTAGTFLGEIADAWLLGEGLHELEDPAAPYRMVTAEGVHAVTSRALDPEARAEGVVAPD